MENKEYDLLFKLILIGDSYVGKSNILLKYLKNQFNENSKTTVGVEFGTKNIIINNKRKKNKFANMGYSRSRTFSFNS